MALAEPALRRRQARRRLGVRPAAVFGTGAGIELRNWRPPRATA